MKNLFLRAAVSAVISMLTCIILAVTLSPQLNNTAYANETEQSVSTNNFTNLIVFAKFDGEAEFINDVCAKNTTVKQIIDNSYSKAYYSVKDYYKNASCGAVDMQTICLLDSYSSSLTLSKPRGYYCSEQPNNPIGYTESEYDFRMNELKHDWADAVNSAVKNGGIIADLDGNKTYGIADLDKNGDGYIDCITIIYKYSNEFSVDWKGCLWNYQAYTDLVELSDENTSVSSRAYLQITPDCNYYYESSDGIKFLNLKTMIHETGHIFGLKDLYNASSASPVFYMSAMANAISIVPQYISTKEREALGWLNEDTVYTVLNEGTYSVKVTANERNGIVGYKCFIPSMEKTLYLEYRKFDGDKNKYDSQSKIIYNKDGDLIKQITVKSGLVCYLLEKNTTFPNNLYSNSRNWNYQVLGGNYATKTDAALGVNDCLQITSNLSVKVTALTDDELTFTLSGSDIQSSHSHNLEMVAYQDSSCTSEGNIEYFKCKDCGKYFLANGAETTLKDTVIAKKNIKK